MDLFKVGIAIVFFVIGFFVGFLTMYSLLHEPLREDPFIYTEEDQNFTEWIKSYLKTSE